MKPPGSWTTLYGMGVIGAADPAGGLLQLHESGHGAGHHAGARNLLAQVHGRARAGQLVVQFLGESVLMALLALAIALALAEVLLPSYSRFMGRPLELQLFRATGR